MKCWCGEEMAEDGCLVYDGNGHATVWINPSGFIEAWVQISNGPDAQVAGREMLTPALAEEMIQDLKAYLKLAKKVK